MIMFSGSRQIEQVREREYHRTRSELEETLTSIQYASFTVNMSHHTFFDYEVQLGKFQNTVMTYEISDAHVYNEN